MCPTSEAVRGLLRQAPLSGQSRVDLAKFRGTIGANRELVRKNMKTEREKADELEASMIGLTGGSGGSA